MARIDQAKGFWKTIKEVSVPAIAREAEKPVAISIVGEPEKRQEVLRALYPAAGKDDVLPERSLISAYDSTSAEVGFPEEAGSFSLIIDAGGGRRDGVVDPVYSVVELGGIDRVVNRILDQRPDLSLALAKRFPGFRHAVGERIVRETALANAEFAMLNALPGVVPIIAPLLPAAALGDIFMLTKNQAMMMFKLAAAHDLPLDVRSRSKDLAPLLGNAFGWRAIAREVVGMVPGGVGLVARGAIAYAGTLALGKALLRFYETGALPTRAQINRYYKEAYSGAKRIAEERLRALRPGGKKEPAQISAGQGISADVEVWTEDGGK
jgi:uncharacterized protein (DUF697 family)